uniref:Uncharacterized protein n=1 Tax=Avena sativa TaxID=4498 RepID=A0ACD5X3K6_AVESA
MDQGAGAGAATGITKGGQGGDADGSSEADGHGAMEDGLWRGRGCGIDHRCGIGYRFCIDELARRDLVESIVEQYTRRYLEVPHVQYYVDVLKMLLEVKSDQELMSMFDKHAKTKVVQIFVQYCDPSEPYEPIKDYCSDDVHIQADNNIKESEDSYLCNPMPENEHVGIDEEKMYLDKEPIPLNVVLFSNKEKDKTYVLEDGNEDESEEDSKDEVEVEEEEEFHEANHDPNVEYDKDDPPMTVGSTYPSMAEFKLALSQHAIKREFEYNTEKSAPCRFRGYCQRRDEDGCPWKIPASTTVDMHIVVVIV